MQPCTCFIHQCAHFAFKILAGFPAPHPWIKHSIHIFYIVQNASLKYALNKRQENDHSRGSFLSRSPDFLTQAHRDLCASLIHTKENWEIIFFSEATYPTIKSLGLRMYNKRFDNYSRI